MNKNDIIVGEYYVYSRSNDYELFGARQCQVLSAPESKQVRNRSTWGTHRANVVKARTRYTSFPGDNVWRAEEYVEVRYIREPWDNYSERQRKAAKQRAAQNEAVQNARNERAKSLLDLIPSLRHAGVEDSNGYIYNADVLAALQEHVPDCLIGEGRFEAPLAQSLVDFVQLASPIKVSFADLTRILR